MLLCHPKPPSICVTHIFYHHWPSSSSSYLINEHNTKLYSFQYGRWEDRQAYTLLFTDYHHNHVNLSTKPYVNTCTTPSIHLSHQITHSHAVAAGRSNPIPESLKSSLVLPSDSSNPSSAGYEPPEQRNMTNNYHIMLLKYFSMVFIRWR